MLQDFQSGKCVILVDDEDRENEGDLVLAAEQVTPDAINFMAKYYKPDGSLFGESTLESTIDIDLDYATDRTGWGWPDYDNWSVGEYRVEVWDGTIKLGESKFTIY